MCQQVVLLPIGKQNKKSIKKLSVHKHHRGVHEASVWCSLPKALFNPFLPVRSNRPITVSLPNQQNHLQVGHKQCACIYVEKKGLQCQKLQRESYTPVSHCPPIPSLLPEQSTGRTRSVSALKRHSVCRARDTDSTTAGPTSSTQLWKSHTLPWPSSHHHPSIFIVLLIFHSISCFTSMDLTHQRINEMTRHQFHHLTYLIITPLYRAQS